MLLIATTKHFNDVHNVNILADMKVMTNVVLFDTRGQLRKCMMNVPELRQCYYEPEQQPIHILINYATA